MTSARFGRDFEKDFDLWDPNFSIHFEEIYDDFHERGVAVARSNVGEGYYVLTRYKDIVHHAKDWQTFSSRDGFLPNRPADMPLWYPVECDPPIHRGLRVALNPYFSSSAIAGIEDDARAHAHGLIDRFINDEEVDLCGGYADPFPGYVFCGSIAHMPTADLPWLARTFHATMFGEDEERGAAMRDTAHYIDQFLKHRQSSAPKGDVIDALLAAEIDDYGWNDKIGTVVQLTMGGAGTTNFVIASALYYLATHPEDRARLVADRSLLPTAIEELIRIYAASPHDGRRVMTDVEVAGTQFKKGDFVLFGYGSACRDPEVIECPAKVDLERSPNRHLAFGAGIHRCLGSHLARLQLRVSIDVFLERIPDFATPEGFEPRMTTGIVRSIGSVPIRLNERARPDGR